MPPVHLLETSQQLVRKRCSARNAKRFAASSPPLPSALLNEVQDRADYAVRMALDAADTVQGAGGLTTYEPPGCRTMGPAQACPKSRPIQAQHRSGSW